MTSLMDNIKSWILEFDEDVYLIFVSFDKNLVENMLDTVHEIKNIIKIVLPIGFIDETKIDGVSPLVNKYPGRVISSVEYGKNIGPCIFFGDFNNTNKLTPRKFDYYLDVERHPKYRKWCRGMLHYRFAGSPQLNGYWLYDKSINGVNGSGSLIFMKRSRWAEIIQGLPTPRINNKPEERINITSNINVSLDWLQSLEELVVYLTTCILETDKYSGILVNDHNKISWVKCFIHETFNKIYGYQAQEFLGDSLSGACFDIYMISKYPRFTQTQLSEYHNQYMSQDHQSYLSDDLGLKDFMLADFSVIPVITEKHKTDLIEAFIGALIQTCSTISINLAFTACLNLMIIIGEQFRFDFSMLFGKPKHRITQLLMSLDFPVNGPDFKVVLEENNAGTDKAESIWYIKISPRFVTFINELKTSNHDISSLPSIFIKYNPSIRTRDAAENDFWEKVAEVFNKANIDIRFAKERRNDFIHRLSTIDNTLYQKFCEKMKLQFPNESVDLLIKRIQFESFRDDKLNYISMYIHTFESAPDSFMLKALTKYVDSTQKAADEYIAEMEPLIQIKNLANVPTPVQKEQSGPLSIYTPYQLGCYRCIYKYVNY